MKIISEKHVKNFEPWAGAKDTFQAIEDADKMDALEATLEDLYPDGMTDTELNDLLWFEPETVYEWLGMTTTDDEDEADEDE